MSDGPTTALCTATETDVFVRGRSLPRELIGKVSFTEMLFFQILGRDPTPAQIVLVDACLVTLMEHGMTPTAVTARLTYTSAPEAMQGAVAAGLLSVGSLFAGTAEGCAVLLARVATAADPTAEAHEVVAEHRRDGRYLPGFGHPQHRPVDPRTTALLALAQAQGTHGAHCDALIALSDAIATARGKPLPPNATGAIAAVLADCGVPAEIMRGFALISRCAGLVGHIHEEQRQPTLRAIWHAAEQAVPYEPPEEDR